MKKIMLLSLMLVLILTACATEDASNVSAPEMAVDRDVTEESMPEDAQGDVDLLGQKVIKTINFDTTTFQYDEDKAAFESMLSNHKGVIENMQESTQGEYRYFNATLRIASDTLDAFIEDLEEHFSTKMITMNTEDVSSQYVDLEARISNLKTREERLRDLMGEADTTESLLLIDQELTNVTYEIERLTGEKNAIDDRVDYSTVYFSLSERREASVQDSGDFLSNLARAFTGGFSSFIRWMQELILFLVRSLPFFILIAVVLAILAVINKRRPLFKRKTIVKNKEQDKE